MNRREVLACLAAGGCITASGLWWPGKKLISIPNDRKSIWTPHLGKLSVGDNLIYIFGNADYFGRIKRITPDGELIMQPYGEIRH